MTHFYSHSHNELLASNGSHTFNQITYKPKKIRKHGAILQVQGILSCVQNTNNDHSIEYIV